MSSIYVIPFSISSGLCVFTQQFRCPFIRCVLRVTGRECGRATGHLPSSPWLQILSFIREATVKIEKSRTFCVQKGMENIPVQCDLESFSCASVGPAGSPVTPVPMFPSSGVRHSHGSWADPSDTRERGRKHSTFVEFDVLSGYFQTSTLPWNSTLTSSNTQGTSFWNVRDFVLEKRHQGAEQYYYCYDGK